MNIIKLNAIPSTNDFLKEKLSRQFVENFTVIVAENQTQGKGQMGASWTSETGKNLTFSVLIRDLLPEIELVFHLNVAVAVSIAEVLQELEIPNVAIKWPNDILADKKKIAGILIENSFKSNGEILSIVGIGLNVNQTEFENLPKAGSLYSVTGKTFNKEDILTAILEKLKLNMALLQNAEYDKFWSVYDTMLFRKGVPSSFEDTQGIRFTGIIQGVNKTGKLEVLHENDTIQEYGIKEITLLY